MCSFICNHWFPQFSRWKSLRVFFASFPIGFFYCNFRNFRKLNSIPPRGQDNPKLNELPTNWLYYHNQIDCGIGELTTTNTATGTVLFRVANKIVLNKSTMIRKSVFVLILLLEISRINLGIRFYIIILLTGRRSHFSCNNYQIMI